MQGYSSFMDSAFVDMSCILSYADSTKSQLKIECQQKLCLDLLNNPVIE